MSTKKDYCTENRTTADRKLCF